MSSDSRHTLDRRNRREVVHVLDKSVLLLVVILLFFGFVPEARVVIGVGLTLFGSLLQASGEVVFQEIERQRSTPEQFSYRWIMGLVLLVLIVFPAIATGLL